MISRWEEVLLYQIAFARLDFELSVFAAIFFPPRVLVFFRRSFVLSIDFGVQRRRVSLANSFFF